MESVRLEMVEGFGLLRDQITASFVNSYARGSGLPAELCWEVLRRAFERHLKKTELNQLYRSYGFKGRVLRNLVELYRSFVEECGEKLRSWRAFYQGLRGALYAEPPIIGQGKMDEILDRYDRQVLGEEDAFLVNVLLFSWNYRQGKAIGQRQYKEQSFWFRSDLTTVNEIRRVVSLVWNYSRDDQSWTPDELVRDMRSKLGLEWKPTTVRALMNILRVEETEPDRWRWQFTAMWHSSQFIRLLREKGQPLSLGELVRLYKERTGEDFDNGRLGTLLTDCKDRFCPVKETGYWALQEWSIERRRPRAAIVLDLLEESDRPLTLTEIEARLRNKGYQDAEDWRINSILGGSLDRVVPVVPKGQPSKTRMWMPRHRFDPNGPFEEVVTKRVRINAEAVNGVLRKLVPPGGELTLKYQELLELLAQQTGVSTKSIARWLPDQPHFHSSLQLDLNSPRRRRFCRYVTIPYRPDGDYWVTKRRDTIFDWLKEEIRRQLPLNGEWVPKRELYRRIKVLRPDLSSQTFYPYLKAMPGIEHYHEGNRYFCRRVA